MDVTGADEGAGMGNKDGGVDAQDNAFLMLVNCVHGY